MIWTRLLTRLLPCLLLGQHMVFMGSEAFPDENAYDSYLQQHGGSSNAYTDAEQTVFHCDCRPDALRGALERFSAQFVAPLCLESATDRELRAVESEFTQAQQSDSARLQQVQTACCSAGHPASKFSWGNASSLGAGGGPKALRELLMQHRGAHYVAPRMTLALLGSQSLDVLQAWVEELFCGVPGGQATPQALPQAPSFASWGPWLAPCHGCLVRLPSVKDAHTLTTSFSLPPLWEAYECKPEEYVSHLLGHESSGSLLSALKARGLATGLCAGVSDGGYERSSCGWTLGLSVSLTTQGLAAWHDVAALLFAACALLRRSGPQRWVWDELAGTKAMEFRFAEEEEAIEYVTRLAANAARFAPQHAVDGEWRMSDWRPDQVAAVLELLTPHHCRLDLQSAAFASTPAHLAAPLSRPGDSAAPAQAAELRTERWMGIPYSVTPLPPSWLTDWSFHDNTPLPPDLALPPRNPYIPTDFSLAAAPGQQAAVRAPPPEDDDVAYPLVPGTRLRAPVPPQRLALPPAAQHRLRAWHKLDGAAGRFGTPRSCAFFCVASPAAASTPAQEALTQVALRVLEDALAEVTYLADVAGLRCHVAHDGMRADLKVDGFSHHLGHLVTTLFTSLAALPATCAEDAPRVARVLEAVERRLNNALVKPLKHATYLRLRLLRSHGHSVEDQLQAVQGCTPQSLAAHAATLLAQCRVDALVLGNTPAPAATALLEAAAAALPAGPHACGGGALAERVFRVPCTGILVFDTARNAAETNSCVECYYQVGTHAAASPRDRALADLAGQVVGEPAFDVLRTKEQLGYTVMCGSRFTHGVLGFVFAVQSAKHGPGHLDDRIEAFLGSFRSVLAAMEAAQFERNRDALVAAKLQKDRALSDEADRHWDAVWHARAQWCSREAEAEAALGITQDDLLAWYDTHLAPGSATRRKLAIRVAAPGIADQEKGLATAAAATTGSLLLLGDDGAALEQLRSRPGAWFDPAPEEVPGEL